MFWWKILFRSKIRDENCLKGHHNPIFLLRGVYKKYPKYENKVLQLLPSDLPSQPLFGSGGMYQVLVYEDKKIEGFQKNDVQIPREQQLP